MQLSVTLDPRKTYAATNPFVYGQSLEHTGGCIYEGLWAEMLEDRKFYYSPNDAESPWTVRGGCVEMVTTLAYAGAYSPTIWLPGGIAQAGLHLEAGREYALRLVVAGVSLRGGIEVALCWGEQPAQRAATVIERVGEDYAALTHSFVPGGTSINGRLEIVGHGKGAMRLGAVSLMPVDNIHGMRRDVLDALKRVNAPLYAWPTGGIADTYDWREGIGPRDRRPPRLDSVRKRLDSNDFGFEEFMALCAETGAEPLVLVNSSEGHVRLAVEQVRFANDRSDEGPAKSRVDGGRSEPYGVTWWGMGGSSTEPSNWPTANWKTFANGTTPSPNPYALPVPASNWSV